MIGRTISHYRILSELGSGGMGVVYRAEDLRLGRQIAVKFLSAQLNADPDARRRLIHEAKAAAALDHSGICTVYDTGEVDGQPFIAMALIEGETLRDRISRGPLPLSEALGIALQVAEALQEAHGKGVVHRDVKPANIMLTPKGQAKVMDFGLAQLAGASQLTRSGTTMGTAAYISPEQARGEGSDHRTDIWSLGVVLYEMVCGRRPFRGDREAVLLDNLQRGEPPSLTGLRTGVPMELERIVCKCLEKDARRRYQHVDELAVDLRRVLAQSDATATVTSVITRRPKSRRWFVVAGALVVLALAWTTGRQLRPNAVDGATRLAIAEFTNLDASPDPSMAAGLTALLQAALVGRPGYEVVSPEYMSDMMRRKLGTGLGSVPAEQVLVVARESSATRLLAGEFVDKPGVALVTWRLVETKTGKVVAAGRTEGADWMILADQVAQAVSSALHVPGAGASDALSLPSAQHVTDNPEAYRHFAASLVAEEGGHYSDARRELMRAVELDSTFALALFTLSRIVDSNTEMALAKRCAEGAARHAERLGAKDRALLDAHRLVLNYKVSQAVRAYNDILSRWPDTREALVRRAQTEVFFRFWVNARISAEEGLRYYPENRDLLQVLATALVQLGRWDSALETAKRDTMPRAWNLDAAGALGDIYLRLAMPDSAQRAYRAMMTRDPDDLWAAAGSSWCAYARGDLELAIRLMEELDRDPRWSAQGGVRRFNRMDLMGLPELYAEAGRLAEIPAMLAMAHASRNYLELYHVYAGLTRETRPALNARIAEVRVSAVGRDYLNGLSNLGIAAARLGDVQSARVIYAEIVPAVLADPDLPRGFYQRRLEMGAVIALAENKPQDALSFLEELSRDGYVRLGPNEIQIMESEAEAAAQAGQSAQSIAILQDLVRVYGGRALAHFKLGELLERAGRNSEAREAYAKCLTLWAHADPGYPYVDRARARLTALNR